MRFALLISFATAISATAADTPTLEEKAAMAAIVKLGGKAEIDSRLAVDARIVVKFDGGGDTVLLGLKKYPQVGAIQIFDASRCTEKGFAALKSLPKLRKLIVEKADLRPQAISAIAECKDLRHLGLVNCGLNDARVAGLKGLTLLNHLALSENPLITDKSMAAVKEFDRLQVLYLTKTAISDKGLAELKVLDGLRTLSVKGTKVTLDAAEKFPEDMPNLRKVLW